MLYAVAHADWTPGLPLTPAQARGGLFRTRESAGSIAAGRPTLAVALRYDPARGVAVATPPAARHLAGGWSAPAILDDAGGVTVLSTIPAELVRLVGPASIRIHPASRDPAPGLHPARPARVEAGRGRPAGGR